MTRMSTTTTTERVTASEMDAAFLEALDQYREAVGMTRAALAEAAGIKPSRMSNIFSGKSSLTAALMSRLAEACGMPYKFG